MRTNADDAQAAGEMTLRRVTGDDARGGAIPRLAFGECDEECVERWCKVLERRWRASIKAEHGRWGYIKPRWDAPDYSDWLVGVRRRANLTISMAVLKGDARNYKVHGPYVFHMGCGEDAYPRNPLRRVRERGLRVCEEIEAAWPIDCEGALPDYDAYLRGMKRWSAILRMLSALQEGDAFYAVGVLNTPNVIHLGYDVEWLTDLTRKAKFGVDPELIYPQRLRPGRRKKGGGRREEKGGAAGRPSNGLGQDAQATQGEGKSPRKARSLLGWLAGDFLGPACGAEAAT